MRQRPAYAGQGIADNWHENSIWIISDLTPKWYLNDIYTRVARFESVKLCSVRCWVKAFSKHQPKLQTARFNLDKNSSSAQSSLSGLSELTGCQNREAQSNMRLKSAASPTIPASTCSHDFLGFIQKLHGVAVTPLYKQDIVIGSSGSAKASVPSSISVSVSTGV
jgi:hypothetical protein